MPNARVGRVSNPDYIDIDSLMIANAIRIYQHWKQLDSEVRAISTRGINFPSELSEIFVCYALGFLWKKEGGGDAFDPNENRIIEIKGSGSERDDLSTFSPSETFDELVFVKVKKDEDALLIWQTGINSQELKKIKVNRSETLEQQQLSHRRPRFSIEKMIIREKGLKPDFRFDLIERTVIDLETGRNENE